MRFDVDLPMLTYSGLPIPVSPKSNAPCATLRDLLELACVNAAGDEVRRPEQKLKVYRLLQKAHTANPFLELDPEDITLLKVVAATVFPVAVYGAIVDALDAPVSVRSDEEKTAPTPEIPN